MALYPSTTMFIIATPLLTSDASAVKVVAVPGVNEPEGLFVSVIEGALLSAEIVDVRPAEVAPALSSRAQ